MPHTAFNHTGQVGAGEVAGSEAPPTLSPEECSQIRRDVEAQIDQFLGTVGLTDAAVLTDAAGWRHFGVGSAQGQAGVVELDNELYLRVESPVMGLPADGDLVVPLMRELLEMHLVITYQASFAIQDDMVIVVATLPAQGLSSAATARCIQRVMSLSDAVDDRLLDKYGGTSKKRIPPVALPDTTGQAEPAPTEAPPSQAQQLFTDIKAQGQGSAAETPPPGSGLFARFNQNKPAAPDLTEPPPSLPTETPGSDLFATFRRDKS